MKFHYRITCNASEGKTIIRNAEELKVKKPIELQQLSMAENLEQILQQLMTA